MTVALIYLSVVTFIAGYVLLTGGPQKLWRSLSCAVNDIWNFVRNFGRPEPGPYLLPESTIKRMEAELLDTPVWEWRELPSLDPKPLPGLNPNPLPPFGTSIAEAAQRLNRVIQITSGAVDEGRMKWVDPGERHAIHSMGIGHVFDVCGGCGERVEIEHPHLCTA